MEGSDSPVFISISRCSSGLKPSYPPSLDDNRNPDVLWVLSRFVDFVDQAEFSFVTDCRCDTGENARANQELSGYCDILIGPMLMVNVRPGSRPLRILIGEI